MENRDTLLSAQFPPATTSEPFVEADLRDLYAQPLLGRRGQLQFTTKLIYKAADSYRQDQSMIRLWADVRVRAQDGAPLPNLGRAVVPDPIYFGPQADERSRPMHHDPWTAP